MVGSCGCDNCKHRKRDARVLAAKIWRISRSATPPTPSPTIKKFSQLWLEEYWTQTSAHFNGDLSLTAFSCIGNIETKSAPISPDMIVNMSLVLKQHLNKGTTVDSDTPAQEQYVSTTLGWIFTFLIGRENGTDEESEGSLLQQICLT